jgi:hypothetical protein
LGLLNLFWQTFIFIFAIFEDSEGELLIVDGAMGVGGARNGGVETLGLFLLESEFITGFL